MLNNKSQMKPNIYIKDSETKSKSSSSSSPNKISQNQSSNCMGRRSSQSLAPGFRFHPTDEELVRYYLKRKVSGKRLRFDPIYEIDIYKSEPWDLPPKSKLQTRDLEWYFFSVLDKKYGNGSKTNRATEHGYWKTTGKDRPVCNGHRTVGMKKTLVYHNGRAPRGQRSNWVMHEYRLTDEELEKAGVPQDAFVLCRVFQKSGPGPKNGEQYGAPFVEEEWEDDDVAVFPDQETMVVTDDAYFETNDLDWSLDNGITPGNTSLPVNLLPEGACLGVEFSEDVHSDEQKPLATTTEVSDNLEQQDENKYFVLPEQYPADVRSIEKEFVGEPTNNVDIPHIEDHVDGGYLFDGPYLDAVDNPFFGDESYMENELSSLIDSDAANFNVGDYLTFFDADDENLAQFESTEQNLAENVVSDQTPIEEYAVEGDKKRDVEYEHLTEFYKSDFASSSNQYLDTKDESNIKYPFMKTASHMLGSFPAPPAFAVEFPSKDATLRLNAIAQPSSSDHVTAGMVRIRNMSVSGTGMNWFVGKNGELNVILSFGISHAQDAAAGSVISSSLPRGKNTSTVSWSCLLCLFFWVLLLSATVKVGSSIYTR